MSLRTDRNLQLLFAALFLWMFGVALYDGLIPIYARQLGASPVELGTLFTVRNLSLAAGFAVGWLLTDRISRRTLIIVAWVLGVPVPLMLVAAPGYLWLLPGLMLYDLTFFGLPAIQAYVTQRVPASDLASTFTIMGTINSVGFLIGPSVGGLIADQWGIRTTLVVAFAIFVISTVPILRLEHGGPGTVPAETPRPLGWTDVRPMAPAIVVAVAISAMVLIPVPFISPFLREVRKLSLSEIGFLGSMIAVGAVALTPIMGRLGERIGLIAAMIATLGMYASGMLLTVYGPGALLPLAAALRCRAPSNALAQAFIGARAPVAVVGRAFALVGIMSALITAAGVFIGGYAYRLNAGYPLLLATGVAIITAAVLAWLRPTAAPLLEAQAAGGDQAEVVGRPA